MAPPSVTSRPDPESGQRPTAPSGGRFSAARGRAAALVSQAGGEADVNSPGGAAKSPLDPRVLTV
jgi:hypothetical protein